MTAAEIARIKMDPRFRELERKRNTFSWTLSIIMLIACSAFIFLVAFGGHLIAVPVWGVVTLAFPLGLGVIVLAVVLTGIYVVKANGEYDELTRHLVSGMAARRTVP
ncbi:MAG: DUF485 domain-containing protein [Acetobacteraceae bacterium]|nr:DUF485 domain-containing protein [Acetobacteraceae bacterium]